jgi:hypothetical protein
MSNEANDTDNSQEIIAFLLVMSFVARVEEIICHLTPVRIVHWVADRVSKLFEIEMIEIQVSNSGLKSAPSKATPLYTRSRTRSQKSESDQGQTGLSDDDRQG